MTYLLVNVSIDRVVNADVVGEHGTTSKGADGLDGTGSTSLEGAMVAKQRSHTINANARQRNNTRCQWD